jgi:MFS family permease
MRGAAVREGLATRELRLYVVSTAATSLALWAFTVVLAITAYKAGGTSAVTLAVLARVLPGALAGPFTALLADRRSRRAVLLALTGGATLALAALTLVVALDAPLAAILALAAVVSILTSGQQPAQAALLPGLAQNPRQLAIANGLRQGFGNAAYCLGALAGGAAAAVASPAAGFAIALAASAAALAAFACMRADAPAAHRTARPGSSVVGELLLGVREIHRAPELRESVGLLAALGLVYGVLDVLMVVVAVKLVGLGTGGVGVLNSLWGAGGLAGGILAFTLLARGRFSTGLQVGAGLVAAPLLLLAAIASPVVAIAGFAVLGIGYAIAETAGQTLVQRLASDETLARAFAASETAAQGAVALGSIAAPLLISALGIRGALVAAACVMPVAVAARGRALRRLDASASVPEQALRWLRAVDVFGPLPLATVETLALRALPLVVFAGDVLLRRGDVGALFYVIADGAVEVDDGTARRRLGPGDYFGEIALLRDVPRTAGVAAAEDGLVYVLGRADFLRAVTGHLRSTQVAQTTADARLLASHQGGSAR